VSFSLLRSLARSSYTCIKDSRCAHNNYSNYSTYSASQSYYILDKNKLINNIKTFKANLPTVKPYYAVKCNNHPFVLKTLISNGFNFDCASIKEIKQIQYLQSKNTINSPSNSQSSPSKIIYANPIKSVDSIVTAKDLGINLYTLDSLDELQKLLRWHSNCGYLLRIAVDDKYSLCKLNGKFGIRGQAISTFFKHYQEFAPQFKGIAFHVGSNCMSPQSYLDALKLVDSIASAYKLYSEPFCLDIGGGFTKSGCQSLFNNISEIINNQTITGNIIAEPGRIIVEDIMDLFVPVIGTNTSSNSVYINNSIYSDFNCVTYDHKILQFSILRGSKEFVFESGKWIVKGTPSGYINNCITQNIYGATCDSMDKILIAECPKLQVGDVLKFHNMGAYTYSSRAEFNGIPLAKVLILGEPRFPHNPLAW